MGSALLNITFMYEKNSQAISLKNIKKKVLV